MLDTDRLTLIPAVDHRPGGSRLVTSNILSVSIAVLWLLAATYAHQAPAKCFTALSRLDLLHALAHGRVTIDAYHANTPDKAERKGHFYSDKAPGTVALAVPSFALGIGVLRLGGWALDSDAGWLFSSWIACVGSIGIIACFGAALVYGWLSEWTAPRHALLTTLAVFLGAAPLPYSTMMFSHALTVGLESIAVWAMTRAGKRASIGDRGTGVHGWQWVVQNRWELLAGFAFAWALASEYTAGIVVAGFFVWLVLDAIRSRGPVWQRVIAFCAAAVPPLLLIPVYSFLCFPEPIHPALQP